MTYRLTIARLELNPKWDEYRSNAGFNHEPYQNETQVLQMEIPPDMFDAIRKAALEVCK